MHSTQWGNRHPRTTNHYQDPRNQNQNTPHQIKNRSHQDTNFNYKRQLLQQIKFRPLRQCSNQCMQRYLYTPSRKVQITSLPSTIRLLRLPLQRFIRLYRNMQSNFLRRRRFQQQNLNQTRVRGLSIQGVKQRTLQQLMFQLRLLTLIIKLSRLHVKQLRLKLQLRLM